MTKTVLIPLPERDFDVTEVAVPWRLLTDANVRVLFATPSGSQPASADPLLLTGVLFGQLGAEPQPRAFYQDLLRDTAFKNPVAYHTLRAQEFDALVLPGGHAPGMREYLASDVLQKFVASYWQLTRPVAAICHGTLVAARAQDPETRKSILYGYRTTCLPKYMERTAYYLTAWKLGNYYRTYAEYVEDEVRRALAKPSDFARGPLHLVARGTMTNDEPTHVVEDRHYLSARWPGDAFAFARKLLARL